MTKTPNRRQVISSVAGMAGAATITKTALASGADTDKHLVDLFDKWRWLDRASLDAMDHIDHARIAAQNEYPKAPNCLMSKEHYTSNVRLMDNDWWKYSRDTLLAFYPTCQHDKINESFNARMKAFAKWESDKVAINKRHNLPALEQRLDAILSEQKLVESALINTPAMGLVGIQAKLSFWACWNTEIETHGEKFVGGPAPDSDLYAVRQALNDLQRLTGQAIHYHH